MRFAFRPPSVDDVAVPGEGDVATLRADTDPGWMLAEPLGAGNDGWLAQASTSALVLELDDG